MNCISELCIRFLFYQDLLIQTDDYDKKKKILAPGKTLLIFCIFTIIKFVVYLEYINNYIVTHTVICNQIFTQGFIPKQSHGTDFHWGPQIIYPRLQGQ